MPGQADSSADHREALVFLKDQGILSIVAVLSLVTFVYYPSTPVAVGCVLFIAGVARVLEARNSRRSMTSYDDKAVLITGCDRGFGLALAKQLTSLGVTVFAGCSDVTRDGAAELVKLDNTKLHVVQMDVTKTQQIQDALKLIKKITDGRGLWGIVNNAGLNYVGDVELTSIEQFEKIINVNQLGMVRVTKTFLPLVRKAKGRVLNVTSAEGRFPLMYESAFDMTQVAVEAFSDILRMEMRKFGVKVILVEPCNFRGAMDYANLNRLKHDIQRMWHSMDPELRHTYGKEYVFHHLAAAEDTAAAVCLDVSRVTDKMVEALFIVQPNTRYLIDGSSQWFNRDKVRMVLYQCLPSWFTDGLIIHGTRDYPNPKSLIGQGHGHSH